MNFVGDRRNLLHASFEISHLATLPFLIAFVWHYLSVGTVVAYSVAFYVLANVYNTLWYHRYCSHYAFRFSSRVYPKLLLWLNPLGYREEVYALRHHIHHNVADEEDDPNGPHLTWLGNYLASSFEIDTDVTPQEYERIKRRLAHIAIPYSSLASFKRWACVEYVPHYLARWLLSNLLWAGLWFWFGGVPYLVTWFAVLFSFHAVLRDFNYRGHGGGRARHVTGRDFDSSSLALNQPFYGFVAGEWHNNHHAFRASANTAFRSGQLDIPFELIRLLARLGVVSRYTNHRALFLAKYAGQADSPDAAGIEPTGHSSERV